MLGEWKACSSRCWLDACRADLPACGAVAKAWIPCCFPWWLPGSSLSICDCPSFLKKHTPGSAPVRCRLEAPASPGSCPQRERRWSEPRARLLLPVAREFESFQQERGLEDFLVDDLDAWRQQGFFYVCQQKQNCHQLISQDDANFRLEESLHVGKQ